MPITAATRAILEDVRELVGHLFLDDFTLSLFCPHRFLLFRPRLFGAHLDTTFICLGSSLHEQYKSVLKLTVFFMAT